MSASREKKKRQEFTAGGASDPKNSRAAEEAAVRRSNRLYSGIFIALAVVAVGLLVYNSGIIGRNQTAVTIDGEKYTVPQTAYYYQQAYQNFMNTYGGYASLFGLDTSKPLKDQAYSEDQSWDEFFKEQAVDNMRLVHAAKTAAKEEGIVLDGEELEAYNENLEAFKSAAAQQGYSYKAYLTAIYGPTMTPSIYEACSQDSFLASKYSSEYSEKNFVYSDEEIQAYYEENKNTYDLVDGGYVTVSGAPEAKTDAEGNAIEATEEEKEAAMAQAKETAQQILDAYNAGQDLESAATSVDDTASYNVSEELSYSSSTYGDWLFDESRRSGDAEILEGDSVYYVAVFNGRQRQEALDYNVRHILITAESLELAEGEEATEEQLTAKAQEILDSWDGTEDGFAALANENSKDPGSNTTGGLYENVPKGQMISEFQNWCYEPGRKAGDTGIVYSASTGAHIMYFVGYGDTQYWHYACENAMVNSAMNEWQQSLIDSVTAETDEGGMKSVG